MNFSTHDLWNNFKQSLLESIQETDVSAFEQAWKSCNERTQFYFDNLLPNVARKLKLGFQKEKPFRIDGIFTVKGNQNNEIPIIYLESENNARSSHEEVYKLCCLNAPLKVLIVCTEWDDQLWKEQIVQGHWHSIIQDFKDKLHLTGHFAFIIAAWMETLKFHSYVLDENAKLIEDTVLIELNP